jgi:alanyl-tRNA synthetase
MTDRLYYTDPYLRAFDATVIRVERRGDHLGVTLDRTAFYPTSGGQPFDTGRLGELQIIDVIDEDDGTITHVAQGFSPAAGTGPAASAVRAGDAVHGVIDWDRRFDHMQQHTGQHVLSAAFDKLFGVRTVSFHLGASVSTIDLAREMTAAEIAAAETEANRVVWEDRPVSIRFADAEEAARLPLRKEPARGGVLRLIEVESFDLSACGGTHVARSGGIGVIAVGAWERFKGGQRLEFVCGARALAAYRTLRDATTASIRLVSVLPNELPGAIERLQAEAKERKRAISGLQADLSRYRAAELVAGGEPIGGCRLVARALDADASGLKNLASEATATAGMLVVLTSTVSPLVVVIARSADVAHSAQHLLTQLVAKFGGRGGGRPEMAQGGGLIATPEAVFDTIGLLIL